MVYEAVAVPIEKEIKGLEKVQHLSSHCTNDGRYSLLITFEPGVDLNLWQLLVHNRLALAEPFLPEAVRDRGIAVRKQSFGVFLFVLLHSPDASKDALYLRDYASIHIQDELHRLPHQASVTLFGEQDYGLQIRLDAEKLAAAFRDGRGCQEGAARATHLRLLPGGRGSA